MYRAILTTILLGGGIVRAEPSQDVVEVRMPHVAYAIHLHGGLVSGPAWIPVAFSVDESGGISALVSGIHADWRGGRMPPDAAAMVSALRNGETVGFRDAQAKRFGPGFLSAYRSALAEAPKDFASQPTVVLVRNTDLRDPKTGQVVNKLDQEWEDALRKDYRKIHPSAHLLVIRLEFPDQPAGPESTAQGPGCDGVACTGGKRE